LSKTDAEAFIYIISITGCLSTYRCRQWARPVGGYTDGFQSIFSLWQLEGKGSCDVDIGQSAGSMVM